MVSLLPRLAWHDLVPPDRERSLAHRPNAAVDATAATIETGPRPRAGTGRALLWSHMLGLRTDVDELHVAAPDLAERLGEISAAARFQVAPGDCPLSRSSFNKSVEIEDSATGR
jgi:hypothetical protein